MPQQVVASCEPFSSVLASAHFVVRAQRRVAVAILVFSGVEVTIEVLLHCKSIVATAMFVWEDMF